MAILISLLFAFFPILSLPFVLIGYFYDQKQNTLYSILFGVIMGLFAYYLQPPITYDLYRHHQLVDDLSTYNASYFFKTLWDTSEPLQALINFGVSLTHNHDLLQFGIVTVGYSILLYVMGDFARRNGIKKSTLLIVFIFTLTSFVCINFFSGLWNSLAMLVFALAFYRDSYARGNRLVTYLLYAITPIIHSAMFFPLVLLVVHKLFKERINFKAVLAILALFLAPSVLLPIINYFTDIPIFAQLEPMYNAYFLNGAQFNGLYDGWVIPMEIAKISLYIFVGLAYKAGHNSMLKLRAFVLLLCTATALLVINSLVFLRFVLLIQFIGSILMMTYLNERKDRTRMVFVGCTIVLDIVFCAYQYMTLRGLDFTPFGLDHLLSNILQIFTK